MKYLKKFESFEEDEVLVAIEKDYPLIVGHRYLFYKEYSANLISVKDIVNNEIINFKYKDCFVTEEEWKLIQIRKETNKYNI